MNYAIFRSEPIMTIADLAQIGSHNKREKKTYNSNPDINIEKSKDNIELVPLNEKYVKGYYELTKEYRKEHDKRMETEREDRKRTFRQMIDNSPNVVADELLFTATPDFFQKMPKEKVDDWANHCLEFVYEDLGYKKEQVLHATVHMDEKTPHMHCVVVPLVKKFDKRTNTERYTLSKKQYIRDKYHLSELQDKYYERLKSYGYDLERGLKGNDKEHLSVKELKKVTTNLEKEITSKESKLDQSINELDEHMKTNKNIILSKDSVKVKKETFECMEQVIKNAKQVQEMQPKIESTFKTVKTYQDNLSKTYKENDSLHHEVNHLSFRCRELENKIAGLSDVVDYLEAIIQGIIAAIYQVFRTFRLEREELKFRDKFEKHIDQREIDRFEDTIHPNRRSKDDDFEL